MTDLAIRNFAKHQHYKNRPGMPWVKFYVKLLDDDDFIALSAATRLAGCLLLLVAQRRGNRLPNSPGWLAAEAHLSPTQAKRALADLLAIGFLVPASEESRESSSEGSSAQIVMASSKTASGLPLVVDSKSASPPARPRALGDGEEKRREVEAKASTPKPPKKEREPDLLWDTLEREIGPVANDNERKKRNKALKLLREAGATPGEIVVRIGRYKRDWKDVTLTDMGVANNWSSLGSRVGNGSAAAVGEPGFVPRTAAERAEHERLRREAAA